MNIPDQVAVVTVKMVSQRAIASAFTEWERRWREEPDRFYSEQERLADSPETYGDACAPYFLAILAERGYDKPG